MENAYSVVWFANRGPDIMEHYHDTLASISIVVLDRGGCCITCQSPHEPWHGSSGRVSVGSGSRVAWIKNGMERKNTTGHGVVLRTCDIFVDIYTDISFISLFRYWAHRSRGDGH